MVTIENFHRGIKTLPFPEIHDFVIFHGKLKDGKHPLDIAVNDGAYVFSGEQESRGGREETEGVS